MTTLTMPNGTTECVYDNANDRNTEHFASLIETYMGRDAGAYFRDIIERKDEEIDYQRDCKAEIETYWTRAECEISDLQEKLDEVANMARKMRAITEKYPWLHNLSTYLNLVEKECVY